MESDLILRFLIALALVLALIGIVALIARRLGFGGRIAPRSGRHRRLGVVEAMALDPKRKLVLLRRDEIEHLLLVGGPTDLVVESGIRRMPHGGEGFERFFEADRELVAPVTPGEREGEG